MAFGGLNANSGTKDVAEINMIPLIDVMLVLLVIFIITAPLLTHAVKVDLPQAVSTPNPAKPEAVQLSIKANGEVYWNTQRMNADEWRTRMQEASVKTPQPEIHIRADDELAYRHIAQVMADATRAGLPKLGFVTDPRDASGRGAE
jgi:biopolymer transport protein ExbD